MNEDGKARQRAARSARLSAALRENLKRRKAQARGRAGAAQETDAERTDADQAPDTEAPDFRRNPSRE